MPPFFFCCSVTYFPLNLSQFSNKILHKWYFLMVILTRLIQSSNDNFLYKPVNDDKWQLHNDNMHILANIGAKFIRIYFILLVDIKIIVFDFTSLCLSHTRQTVPKIVYNCLFVYIILIDKLENAIVSDHLSYWPPLFLPIFSNHFPYCLGNFITPTQHIVVTDRFKTSFFTLQKFSFVTYYTIHPTSGSSTFLKKEYKEALSKRVK